MVFDQLEMKMLKVVFPTVFQFKAVKIFMWRFYGVVFPIISSVFFSSLAFGKIGLKIGLIFVPHLQPRSLIYNQVRE